MNRFHILLLISAWLVQFAATGQVQDNNEIKVEVSREKVVIDGIKYYLHTVKKGENIYRISLAYGVTQTDIINSNPEAAVGALKEGQILKIPVSPSSEETNPLENDKFIHHIVEEGQTLFSLTQKYKISTAELIRYNPVLGVSPALQVGQVVNIPKISFDEATSQTIQRVQKYAKYKVKKHETKYSIAKQYNITLDELIAANPILNTEDLKAGQTIQVPLRDEVDIIEKTANGGSIQDNSRDTAKSVACSDYVPFSNRYKVAMLLPFFLAENQAFATIDTLLDPDQAENRAIESKELYQRTMNFVEFYEGALLAIDSLKKAGIRIQIFTYDADRDTNNINRILKRPEMKDMDMIIGPFYADAVEQVAKFAFQNKIKLISPVSDNCTLLQSNPYVYQVIPSNRQCVSTMMKYIATIPNKNIVLVFSNKQNDSTICSLYKTRLDSDYAGKYKLFTYDDNSFEINSLLSKDKTNIVIFPTENEGLASTVLPMLNLDLSNDSIEVFGLPIVMKWNTIDPDYLFNLKFHFCSSFYADYTNNKTLKRFLQKYETYNFSQPYFHTRENYPLLMTREGYNFGYLGYDVTFYFLSALSRYGSAFDNCLNGKPIKLVHSNFDFQRYSPNGGFINKGVNILSYTHDYKLVKVN